MSGIDPVYILLSTFNGEKFLRPLLDSVLAQDYPNTYLIVRDDGSGDETKKILKEYVSRYSRISVVFGSNVGAVRSFHALLDIPPKSLTNAFFAFCDQDDIWHTDKISRAIKRIHASGHSQTTLYFSRLELVSATGANQGVTDIPHFIGFENAVVENIVTGATAVFGSAIREWMLHAEPEKMVWHDWWAYLVGSALGHVVFDEIPSMQSRRHSDNLTTMRMRPKEGLAQKIALLKKVLRRKRVVHPFEQAAYFDEIYGDLLDEDKRQLLQWLGRLQHEGKFLDRVRFAIDQRFVVNDRMDSLGLRALVLLGLN